MVSLPRGALVVRVWRNPLRLRRLEVGHVESRLREQPRPVELRGRRVLVVGDLRRDSVEIYHPTARVERDARHARDHVRRVGGGHVLPVERDEAARTLAIPEAERDGTARLQTLPAVRRFVVGPDEVQIVVVDEEARVAVRRRVVSELPRDLDGALLQPLGRLVERHDAVEQNLVR